MTNQRFKRERYNAFIEETNTITLASNKNKRTQSNETHAYGMS